MSYAVQQPPVAQPPRRPVTVVLAAVLLAVMGVVGLGYAVATLAITPAVVDKFRNAAAAADRTDVDGLVTVVWIGAAVGAALAIILFALYLVLALGLRRGSNASRIGVWVLAGLGLLAGCGTTVAVLVQRSGDGTPGSLGSALSDSYPSGWIGLNIALAVAQMLGYVLVVVLLIASPGAFFGRSAAPPPATPTYGGIPPYGASSYGPSPYGAPGPGNPAYGPPPGPGNPAYGPPPGQSNPAYGPPPGQSDSAYGLPPGQGNPAYGPPPGQGNPAYGPAPGHGVPAGGSPSPDWPTGYERPASYASPPGNASAGSSGPAAPPPISPARPGPDDELWSRPAE